MEISIKIPEYSKERGFSFKWEPGYKITVRTTNNTVQIIANKEGLISLSRHMLSLAQESFAKGYHLHLDSFNCLEDNSTELIIEKE